jgi:hypothetical protein
MKRVNGLWVGWVPTAIGATLEELPELLEEVPYALITCLDSGRDLPVMCRTSPELRSSLVSFDFLGDGLVLPTSELLELAKGGRIFYGFDEIWFLPVRPVEPKPDDVYMVAPLKHPGEMGAGLPEWMARSQCVLALGDGYGMNYATNKEGLANSLQEKYQNKLG